MINKPTIIITSLGRTGTLFFQALFEEVYPRATVLHEPDYFNFGQYRGLPNKIAKSIEQIHESGFSNLVVKKLAGKWSVHNLSDQRIQGLIDSDRAVDLLLSYRKDFIQNKPGPLYIESSSAWYGLLDILNKAFESHRAVYIIRNGVDWVRSKLNFGNIYNKGPLRSLVSNNWLTPLDLENDPYQTSWDNMTRFQRICWAWTSLNRKAIQSVNTNPDAILVKFEDIFHSENRLDHLEDLLRFTSKASKKTEPDYTQIASMLENKIHRSSGEHPGWEGWSDIQKTQFEEICGDLMDQYQYQRR